MMAGAGTDAQDHFLKAGGFPDGQSQQQLCFSSLLYFGIKQVFVEGRSAALKK